MWWPGKALNAGATHSSSVMNMSPRGYFSNDASAYQEITEVLSIVSVCRETSE